VFESSVIVAIAESFIRSLTVSFWNSNTFLTPYRTGFPPAELLQLISNDIHVIYSKAPDLAWCHGHDSDPDKGKESRKYTDIRMPEKRWT
jgi:hypothetical protein